MVYYMFEYMIRKGDGAASDGWFRYNIGVFVVCGD